MNDAQKTLATLLWVGLGIITLGLIGMGVTYGMGFFFICALIAGAGGMMVQVAVIGYGVKLGNQAAIPFGRSADEIVEPGYY